MESHSTPRNHENTVKRPSPIYIDPAVPLTYEAHPDVLNHFSESTVSPNSNAPISEHSKQTWSLPVGTQRKLQAGTAMACELGHPINALETIRLNSVSHLDSCSLVSSEVYELTKEYVGRSRKLCYRKPQGLPNVYVWVREYVPGEGEHLHFGFHLPPSHRKSRIAFLERTFEPALKGNRPTEMRTRGEIACGVTGSWHLAVEVPSKRSEFPGYWIASYLGKGEPSRRAFRGKEVNNEEKSVRGIQFGGSVQGDRYDREQGLVLGNQWRKGRYGISRNLSSLIV